MRIFSYKNRPVHLGPYPLERLTRQRELPPMGGVPETQALNYDLADPHSIAHAPDSGTSRRLLPKSPNGVRAPPQKMLSKG